MHRNQIAPTVPCSITPEAVSSRRGAGANCTGLTDLVELHAKRLGHHRDSRTPTERDDSGHHDSTLVVERLAEPEELTHLVDQVVAGIVGDLEPPDRVNPARHRCERHSEQIATETRFDARGVDRAVASLRRVADAGSEWTRASNLAGTPDRGATSSRCFFRPRGCGRSPPWPPVAGWSQVRCRRRSLLRLRGSPPGLASR